MRTPPTRFPSQALLFVRFISQQLVACQLPSLHRSLYAGIWCIYRIEELGEEVCGHALRLRCLEGLWREQVNNVREDTNTREAGTRGKPDDEDSDAGAGNTGAGAHDAKEDRSAPGHTWSFEPTQHVRSSGRQLNDVYLNPYKIV